MMVQMFFRSALLVGFLASNAVPASAPTFRNEQLHYTINWPSGLGLGEGQLRASRSKPAEDAPERLDLEFSLEAAVPGFAVLDKYHSLTSSDFCSVEFSKNVSHGKRKAEEKTTFDLEKQIATRQTTGGGKSELKSGACGKDALAFLYFVRRELAQGRIPPSQSVFFGAEYQIQMEYKGTQTMRLGEAPVEMDKMAASLKGASGSANRADVSFEVYFLKDKSRTPALVRVPFAMGTFSMELVPELVREP